MSDTKKTAMQTTKPKLSHAAIGGIAAAVVSGFVLLGVLSLFYSFRKRDLVRLDDDPVSSAPDPDKSKGELSPNPILSAQEKPT